MNLCVIPARGGSKRVPRKNIRSFLGKPVIAYTIEAALESGIYDEVMVSTEDEEIAQIAQEYGAKVPYFRPMELADDHSTTADVVLNVIDWYEQQGHEIDMVSYLYPVNPFLTKELLLTGYEQWQASELPYCFAVCEFHSAPQRGLAMNEDGSMRAMFPQYRNTRTQDIEKMYYDTGMFYFNEAKAYKEGVPVHSEAATAYVLPRHLAHDIDTEEDWKFAELVYQSHILNKLGD